MIRRDEDGWVVFYDDEMNERMRVKLPEGGLTVAEWKKFRDHLLKLTKDQMVGPN